MFWKRQREWCKNTFSNVLDAILTKCPHTNWIWGQLTWGCQSLPPMSHISIDLLGAMEISCFPGSRKTRKIYPLIIGDVNYKGVSFELLEGASGYDIGLGLLTHQAKYSLLTLVISDKGTAIGGNVINLQTSDGMGVLDTTIFHLTYST